MTLNPVPLQNKFFSAIENNSLQNFISAGENKNLILIFMFLILLLEESL